MRPVLGEREASAIGLSGIAGYDNLISKFGSMPVGALVNVIVFSPTPNKNSDLSHPSRIVTFFGMLRIAAPMIDCGPTKAGLFSGTIVSFPFVSKSGYL